MDIRNIAIIAHVDHGKTTLTDALLRQNGAVSDASASMDSNTLEKERGITIYAKNTALFYKDTKINIVDTPGHADFGSEVERVLRSIDCVLLIVDAQEGPMPQTRFVLKKSLELGLKPIVVINKIDKPAANPALCEEQVFDLFVELGASDEQAEFPVIYAIGRQGIAKKNLADESTNLNPLLDEVLKHVPAAPQSDASVPLRLQTFNLAYDNFLGRMAVGRVYDGVLNTASTVVITNNEGVTRKGKITKMFTFKGFERVEAETVGAGDIVMIAGIPDITIGETVSDRDGAVPLPPIHVDEPTISLNFLVNNSPFAGKDGKFVTSRQIRDRLERELEINVGLKVVFTSPDAFEVSGRGELHIAILLEQMRREGFEMQVSQPRVITREENGQKVEPFEEVTIDTPNEYQGAIIERLGMRGFMLTNMVMKDTTTRITLEGPTRGLLGYRGQFVIDTKGEGILSSQVIGFKHFTGTIQKRVVGSMISMMSGTSISFALWNLQDRGLLYIGPQVEVYEGMVIGNTSKGEEMVVNPIKGKQLTNMRASGTDEAVKLTPPFTITIERGLEIMNDDEYLEITPNFTRIRKQGLTENDRNKSKR
ncbi:MAG: translational GTPase TypA [Minisyncoccia bacterium]